DNGIVLCSKWRQYQYSFGLFVITTMSVVGTVVYAFMSTLSEPVPIFITPKTTILILTIGSGVSVFLLGQLVASAFDHLRWILAAGPNGIDLATFLSLGKATDLFGIVRLFYSNNKFDVRKWSLQRYYASSDTDYRIALILFRILLGVILLSSIRVEPNF